MYVNFLSKYSDKKSCHTSTTLQTSIARFVSAGLSAIAELLVVMWPLSACRSASWCKISLISDNRLMNYGQKSDFQDGGRRHLEFKNLNFWSRDRNWVQYLM